MTGVLRVRQDAREFARVARNLRAGTCDTGALSGSRRRLFAPVLIAVLCAANLLGFAGRSVAADPPPAPADAPAKDDSKTDDKSKANDKSKSDDKSKSEDKKPPEPHSWADEICKHFCPWHYNCLSSGYDRSAGSSEPAKANGANADANSGGSALPKPPPPAPPASASKPFSNEDNPAFVASFAPVIAIAGSNPAQPDSDANAPAANNAPADSSSGLKDKLEEEPWKILPSGWNFHAQTTLIDDFQPGFGALYSGPNSLGTEKDREGTITADLFLGAPLWQGAEFHFDLLMWQGFGLSNSFGIESFPNADAYKSGSTTPRFMAAHFFIRQTIGLGGDQEDVPDGQFTLPGKRDISRITITAGRFTPVDIFDQNTYNHDGHTQFFSWASSNLSWDYPADTIGFTTGVALELNQRDWALRYGWFQLPGMPNGFTADDRIFMWPVEQGEITSDGDFWKQWGMITEFERRWHICDHPGAVRLQAWVDHGLLADYNAATTLLLKNPPPPNTPQGVEITVPSAAFSYRSKYGFGVNWEQEIVKNVGTFGRVGWQDGETAAAAFTDVDWFVQAGISIKGAAWHRPNDIFGLLGNLSGASADQQAFLKAGGTGILNGDGNLTYACEKTIETYYDFALGSGCRLAFDYQFFADPAFNQDRGPVSVFGVRLHWEI